jgi:hypothetical protein
VRILFNAAEAFGLGAVLEQSLGLIAFGIPKEATYASGSPRAQDDRAAI